MTVPEQVFSTWKRRPAASSTGRAAKAALVVGEHAGAAGVQRRRALFRMPASGTCRGAAPQISAHGEDLGQHVDGPGNPAWPRTRRGGEGGRLALPVSTGRAVPMVR